MPRKISKKSCWFTVGTSQGRVIDSFPVSRNGWKDAIRAAQEHGGRDDLDINFSCGDDAPFGPRSLFLVTCSRAFKSHEYIDPNHPKNPNVCTTVYAQRQVRDMPSPVLARRRRRK